MKRNYKFYSDKSLMLLDVENSIKPTNTVLDIGCGIRPQQYFKPKLHILCEPFRDYQNVLKEKFPNKHGYLRLQSTWEEVLFALPDKSIDTIFLLDVIEHLPKKTGIQLLKRTIEKAINQIVIFTPYGFIEQKHKDGIDLWGMKGGKWQEHRSGWMPSDFDSSWNIYIDKKFHPKTIINGKVFKPVHGAMFAIKNMSDIRTNSKLRQIFMKVKRKFT